MLFGQIIDIYFQNHTKRLIYCVGKMTKCWSNWYLQ